MRYVWAIFLASLGFGASVLLNSCTEFGLSKKNIQKEQDVESPHVEVLVIDDQKLYDPIIFAGILTPRKKSKIYSPLAGQVRRVYQQEGAKLILGQKIVAISPDSAGYDYRNHLIKAPIGGTLIHLAVEPSEHIIQHALIAEVADLSEFSVVLHAAISDLSTLHVGMTVQVELIANAANSKKRSGKIVRISPLADQKTATFPFVVNFSCQQECENIYLGSMVKVIAQKNLRKAIVVPMKYLYRQGKRAIIIDEQNHAQWLSVKTGRLLGDHVEIVEGLKKGQSLVKSFSRKPENGEVVVIEPEKHR